MKKENEVKQVIEDLMYIKNAITKNSNIFKFISITEILKTFLLVTGIMIIAISGGIYYLIQHYGGFTQIPTEIKTVIYGILILATIMAGIFKSKKLLQAAKYVNQDITVGKLISEVYTTQSLLVIFPFLITIGLTTVFFVNFGHTNYIVPFLALFVGLLCNSMVNIFYLKELSILGGWLVLSSLISLLALITLHPLLIVIFTFGMGFIILYGAILVISASEKE